MIAATRVRDRAGVVSVEGDVCDAPSHVAAVARLVARVERRPELTLRRVLVCGCRVVIR